VDRYSRMHVLRLALAAAGALLVDPRVALAQLRAPTLERLTVRNAGRRYAGDRRLFATVSPGVAGRDRATIGFKLERPATVQLDAIQATQRTRKSVWRTRKRFGAGKHRLSWRPGEDTEVGSYLMQLTVQDRQGKRTYGKYRPVKASLSRAPVVRVLGVAAAFDKRSYAPFEPARLTVTADAKRLTVQFIACGTEAEYSERPDELSGRPIGEPRSFDWTAKRSSPQAVVVSLGPWPSGVYAARLTTDDGRVGFAPVLLRPATLGTVRQAVVMPTNTWQAYNFDDADGDGWGDTWYAGGSPPVRLNRPYLQRGTPAWFSRREAPFLKFLRQSNRTPDFLAEDDVEAFPSGDELRRLYDLVVYPGHTEYVTQQEFDVIQRYRDLGGRLIMLSANNFFWKVEKNGQSMRRIRLWRDLGRPESALFGVQYRANDDGSRQGVVRVMNTEALPWLFEGTGLVNGSVLGDVVGGYGIEIDQTTVFTPPNTIVVGEIPDLYGPGLTAQMTYYETEKGARVFSAGVLDFVGSAPLWPVRRLLDNLWRHLTQ
jgi:N,N-dimethylformamidase beta subunit-like protein